MGHDPIEDLVKVEAGANGLADLAERLQLVHLLPQLSPGPFQRTNEARLPDGDGRLSGERGEIGADRVAGHKVDTHVGQPGRTYELENLAVDEVDLCDICPAESPGADHRSEEDRVDVGRGSANRGEHLIGREELLLRLGKLTTHAFNSGVAALALVPVDGHGGLLIAPP